MRAKRYNGWFKCAHCPLETDTENTKGYEIEPGVIVCEKCYKELQGKEKCMNNIIIT